jgi:hypothetical protein
LIQKRNQLKLPLENMVGFEVEGFETLA